MNQTAAQRIAASLTTLGEPMPPLTAGSLNRAAQPPAPPVLAAVCPPAAIIRWAWRKS